MLGIYSAFVDLSLFLIGPIAGAVIGGFGYPAVFYGAAFAVVLGAGGNGGSDDAEAGRESGCLTYRFEMEGCGCWYYRGRTDMSETNENTETRMPKLREKGRLMSASEIERTLVRLAHEIVEKNDGAPTSGWSESSDEAFRWRSGSAG